MRAHLAALEHDLDPIEVLVVGMRTAKRDSGREVADDGRRDYTGSSDSDTELRAHFTNLRDGRAALSGIEPLQISLFIRENLS